jgi:biotin transport system substrate-specific component
VLNLSATATERPLTLGDAALRDRSFIEVAALVCSGAGLIALAAQLSVALPFTPVPITGQTFAVLLVGAGLGALRGGASAFLYLALGATNAPVFAHGASGIAVITGASGGYLVSFPIAAAFAGWLSEKNWDRSLGSAIGAMLTANLLIYGIGVPWLALSLHTTFRHALELGLYPFVPGDILKLYLAAATLPAAWHLIGRKDGSRAEHAPRKPSA